MQLPVRHDFSSTTPAPRSKTIVSPDLIFPPPIVSENSKKSPDSTWKMRSRASSPPARLFRFSTASLRAASSSTRPTFHRESKKKSPAGGSAACVSAVPTTCRYIRLSAGTLFSPLAERFMVLTLAIRAAGLLGFTFGLGIKLAVAVCCCLPHPRTFANIDFIVSFGDALLPCRAPSGVSLAQSCSSRRRCLRQYWWLQLGQRTPGSFSVLISVLQVTW